MAPRRSTASITLVLIGSAAFTGCGEEAGRRDIYRSQAECMQDWGNDASRCERVRSGSHTGYYYGPYYSGRQAGSRSIGSTQVARSSSSGSGSTVSRSGFGSSSAAHASSSSS